MDTTMAIWLNRTAQHGGLHQAAVIGAKYLVAAPVLIVIYLLVRSTVRRDGFALAGIAIAGAGTGLALLANMAATSLWFRARPYNSLGEVHGLVARATESSFFSDHTVAVTGCALAALLVSRRWGLVSAIAAVGVAIARVAVGAHYPTDVLTAAVVTAVSIGVLLPLRHHVAAVLGNVVRAGHDLVTAQLRRPQ